VIVAEFVFTFLLCFIVLTTATVKNMSHSKDIFGLAIGFSVVVGGYAIGPISGAQPSLSLSSLLSLLSSLLSPLSSLLSLLSSLLSVFVGGDGIGPISCAQPLLVRKHLAY